MATNRIAAGLASFAAHGKTAVLPYITGGYPNLDLTLRLIRRFDEIGAAAVEVGFPFSDSIADGPVIQDSFHRVLATDYSLGALFGAVSRVRPHVELPLLAMVSCSIVDRVGLDEFVKRAADAGFDGLIVPDVPLEEADRVAQAARGAGLDNIMLVAASTPADRVGEIVKRCSGFVYQIAAAGTTGQRDAIRSDLAEHVQRLRGVTSLPVCVGFGISKPEHVREVGGFADGAIVGSAIVQRITDAVGSGMSADDLVATVSSFVGDLVAATQ